MKTRNSFVSNSSSSSFIIVIKGDSAPCPHCGRSCPDILKVIEGGYYNNEIKAEGKNKVLERIKKWGEDYWDKELIKKIKKHPSQNIAWVEVSHHDSNTLDILDNPNNVEILYRDSD